jgi:hypothetical protein
MCFRAVVLLSILWSPRRLMLLSDTLFLFAPPSPHPHSATVTLAHYRYPIVCRSHPPMQLFHGWLPARSLKQAGSRRSCVDGGAHQAAWYLSLDCHNTPSSETALQKSMRMLTMSVSMYHPFTSIANLSRFSVTGTVPFSFLVQSYGTVLFSIRSLQFHRALSGFFLRCRSKATV